LLILVQNVIFQQFAKILPATKNGFILPVLITPQLNRISNSNRTWNGGPDQITSGTSFHNRNSGNYRTKKLTGVTFKQKSGNIEIQYYRILDLG
jgi:hypothetical protein